MALQAVPRRQRVAVEIFEMRKADKLIQVRSPSCVAASSITCREFRWSDLSAAFGPYSRSPARGTYASVDKTRKQLVDYLRDHSRVVLRAMVPEIPRLRCAATSSSL